jgi:hypothetical protein
MQAMCGADLSELDEQNPDEGEGNPGKKTRRDKSKEKNN